MDEEQLRPLYVKDLMRAPRVKAAIIRAAEVGGRPVPLHFDTIKDDPTLLYACWGYARTLGVPLLLQPDA